MKRILYILALFFTFLAPAAGQQGMLLVGDCSGAGQHEKIIDSYNFDLVVSFYLLNSAYTGPCIKVRRSSDDSTTDIGFCAGYVDTVELKKFVGSNTAYINIWYDQSGTGNDLSQSVLADQLTIVQSGDIVYVDGEMSAYAQAADDYLENAAASFSDTVIIFEVLSNSRDVTCLARECIGCGYFVIMQNGSTSTAIDFSVGTARVYRKNGTDQSITNRDVAHDTYTTGNLLLFTAKDMAFTSWTAYRTEYFASASFGSVEYITELLIAPNTENANMSTIENAINSRLSIY